MFPLKNVHELNLVRGKRFENRIVGGNCSEQLNEVWKEVNQ